MKAWLTKEELLWSLTGLLIVGFPVLNFFYWDQVLMSGTLPPESDSIGIPIFGSVVVTVLLSPFIVGIAWLCLRRYNPKTQITAWRRDRPFRSAIATIVFGGGAAALAFRIVADFSIGWPWYEYLWTIYPALWIPWLLSLRAAIIEQL